LRAYFEQRYSPNNMALVAAGNVDFDRLGWVARRCCGCWTPVAAGRETPRAESHSGLQVFRKHIATQQYAVRIAAGPAAEDEDRFAGRILATVLGDDSGSRLYWALVDNGRAEYAAASAYEFQGAGILMTYLCCAPDEAERNLQIIAEIERDLERNGITNAELEQAQSKLCSHLVLQSERPVNRLFSVGGNWIQRREHRTVREMIKAYRAVTVRDVAAVLQKYPVSVNTTTAVGPLDDLGGRQGKEAEPQPSGGASGQ
jgi:predicted Zn-dependent peptidase